MNDYRSAHNVVEYLRLKKKQQQYNPRSTPSPLNKTTFIKPHYQNFRKPSQYRSKSKSHTNLRARAVLQNQPEQNALYNKTNLYQKRYKPQDLQITHLKTQVSPSKFKPTINFNSLQLFQKRKQQRNLSPNVFQRLQNYQREKSIKKILNTINRIKSITPQKKINQKVLLSFATRKELQYFSSLPPDYRR